MSQVYSDKAKNVVRKFTLIDDCTMEVEDDVTLLDARSTVTWQVITKARVQVSGRNIHLTRNGKHFYMQISAPAGVDIKTTPAKTSFSGEKPIEGYTIIEATCPFKGTDGKIKVRMSSKKR